MKNSITKSRPTVKKPPQSTKAAKKPPAKNAATGKKQQPGSSANGIEPNNKSPKLQQKMRSIFSPENSSMSSDSSENEKDTEAPSNSK